MPIESCQINGTWVDGAVATNPVDNTVLATTGALGGGDYFFAFLVRSTADTTVDISQRNTANDADLHAMTIPTAAGSLTPITFPTKITILRNERVIVRQEGNLTGVIQASIFYSKIVG
jgi:hypothetical protein